MQDEFDTREPLDDEEEEDAAVSPVFSDDDDPLESDFADDAEEDEDEPLGAWEDESGTELDM